MGKTQNHQFVETDDFDYFKSSNGNWPNQILNIKVGVEYVQGLLENIEQQSKTGHLPAIVKCDPNRDSIEMVNTISTRGYSQGQWTAMTHFMNESWHSALQTSLKISLVKTQEELQAWFILMQRELMGGVDVDYALFDHMFKSPKCFFYLGYINDQPAATSLFYIDEDGNGGVYLVSTHADHRKRGFGAAVTAVCLNKAKELGCTRIDIQATDLGKGVYQKLGFIDLGKINVFRLNT
jgi:GNAT superfamily N-acetyltransferase